MDDTRTARDRRTGTEVRDGDGQDSGDPGPAPTPEGVVCGHCQQGLPMADSCAPDTLVISGRRFERSRETVLGPDGRCGDCGILDGGVHHLGCDLERCPRCHRQLISCGCLDGGFRLEGPRGA